MTTSSTNIPTDHAAEVRRLLSVASRTEPEGIRIATRAQVHATLALAHEQRTANLIAFLATAEAHGDADESTRALNALVITRLGLGEPA